MNISYDINSDTGIMRLKFKKDILSPLGNQKEIFEKYILPMLSMNDKFLLTGSLSLKLLGFEPIDNIGDFDFGLIDKFTEEDYHSLKNFFGLHDNINDSNYKDIPNTPFKFDENAHLWQFSKTIVEVEKNAIDDALLADLDVYKTIFFKLDIFNDEIIRKRDIITIYYDDFPVKLVHPSITLSYRMRYALDNRGATSFKYWKKMKEFMDNAKEYYTNLRSIQTMNMRVHEHNTLLTNNKDKISQIRALIQRRETNMDEFFNKVFDKEWFTT